MVQKPNKKGQNGFILRDEIRMKWEALGTFPLSQIVNFQDGQNGKQPIEYEFELGVSRLNPSISGQIDVNGVCQGVGKKI